MTFIDRQQCLSSAASRYIIGATTSHYPNESSNYLAAGHLSGVLGESDAILMERSFISNSQDITLPCDGTASSGYGSTAFRATFIGSPEITSLSPTHVLTDGGQSVVITGSAFTDVTAVTFGDTPASSFTVDSSTQITAVTPARAAGAADVVVTSDRGASDPQTVTYGVVPTISSTDPAATTTLGGDTIVLTGTGFTDATAVSFGDTAAASFTVDSDTQITAVTPARAAGSAEASVATAFGTSTEGPAVRFVAPPTLTSVSPDSVSTLGGDTVVLTGTGFTDATAVSFGDTAATSFTVDSDTQITAVTPAGTAGADADVLVTTRYGSSTAGSASVTYVAPPTVIGVTPATGTAVGGTTVVISGTGFTGATDVTFGGTSAASFTVDSDTQITAITPARSAGAADVRVTTAYGTSEAGAAAVTFVAPPAPVTAVPTGAQADELGATGAESALPLAVLASILLVAGLAFTAASVKRRRAHISKD